MKIECVKERFESALGAVEKISSKTATLPILSAVFLEAKNGTLLLRTTNLELGVELSIPVKVVKEGRVALPAHTLLSFVSAIQGEKNISLEVEGGVVIVSLGKSVAKINTLPVSEFPSIPALHTTNIFTFPLSDFVEGVKAVLFSSATTTLKPEYASILFHIEGDIALFVATDSFRLAEKKITTKRAKTTEKMLIPSKNAAEIARTLSFLSEKEVEVRIEGQQAAFVAGSAYITSRLIEGSFPDYKQIIPKEPATEVVVGKEDLLGAMRAATIFSDSFLQVGFSINPKEKRFSIETKNQTTGEQQAFLPAAFKGEAVSMNFNHRYVMDAFPSIHSDNLSFSFNGPNKPVIIRGASDKSFMYIVMPMNR